MIGESSQPQTCKVLVHAIKASNLKKHSKHGAPSAFLTLQMRDNSGNMKRTRAINNDLNPVWNELFEFHCKNKDSDSIVVNMYYENNGRDKMMNEVVLPVKQWPIGTHIDYQEDVSLDNKNAGRLFLGIDIENEDKKPSKQRPVKVAHKPKRVERHETEVETETETEPVSSVQSRGIHLEDPSCEYCDFSWGNYDSKYSTDFTGFTENSETLSALRSSEERMHHHHYSRNAVPEPLKPIDPEDEESANCIYHPSDCSCQHCNFKWGDLDSRYSTDFTGFTENSRSLSALHSSEEKLHHEHRTKPVNNAQDSILANDVHSEEVQQQPAQEQPNLDNIPVSEHPSDCSCQHCHFKWDNLDSRYSTDFTGFTDNSRSLSPLNSTEENFHHNHKQKPAAQNSILAPEALSGDNSILAQSNQSAEKIGQAPIQDVN